MGKHFKKRKKVLFNIIKVISIVSIITSTMYIVGYCFDSYHADQDAKLLEKTEIDNIEKISETTSETISKVTSEEISENIENINEESSEEAPKEIPEKTERMLKISKLKEQNSDTVGWIEIEGTNINYPVLQGDDNSFYMDHNFDKQYSKFGSIFLDTNYDWDIPNSNLLIYGHNVKNRKMFQDLLNYKDQEYYEEHPTIKFTTEDEDAEYEIIAVLESKIYYKTEEDAFRYYLFINADSEEEYNKFVESSKKESLYNIDKTAKYGEQLLTLSTCSYHTKDGRFAVVAVKKNPVDNATTMQ